jgi:hypothetical protein
MAKKATAPIAKPFSLVDTRVIYCGGNHGILHFIRGLVRMKATLRITSHVTVLLLMALCTSLRAQQMTPTPTLLESYTSLPTDLQDIGKIQQEAHVNTLWKGAGHVLAGRIVLENGDNILNCRSRILADGRFCVAVYRGRDFVVYAHGYEPLILTPPSSANYPVAYYGDIKMTRLPKAEFASVKGTLVDGTDVSTPGEMTTLRLILDQPPPIWADWGSEGSSIGFTPAAAEKTMGPGAFEFKGLSPSPYRLNVSRKGYIVQSLLLSPDRKEVIDLGNIVLQKARVLTFRYISRTRAAGGNWNEQSTVAVSSITCDGHSALHYTDAKDGLGNKLDLILAPKDHDVQASFFFGPGMESVFYDLGQGSVESIGIYSHAEDLVAHASPQPNVILQIGHCYLFSTTDVNRTDVDLLFQVDEK